MHYSVYCKCTYLIPIYINMTLTHMNTGLVDLLWILKDEDESTDVRWQMHLYIDVQMNYKFIELNLEMFFGCL